MARRDELEQGIQGLSDEAAVRALMAVAEERGVLTEASELPSGAAELAAGVDAADLEAYLPDRAQLAVSDGELARAVLEYAARSDDLAGTVGEAVAYARSPMDRFDLVGFPVTALVIAILQTEVIVKRDRHGKWSLTIHKRALRDSALGKVLTGLLSRITGGE
ncbi:hypothetical protein [Streptomyces sp. NPDC056682]|uniref:hypothetical protein n=1 Tax=Streptomyces sp. NPDC056682 TaxID=3345909 RepID=UPI0036AE1D62